MDLIQIDLILMDLILNVLIITTLIQIDLIQMHLILTFDSNPEFEKYIPDIYPAELKYTLYSIVCLYTFSRLLELFSN